MVTAVSFPEIKKDPFGDGLINTFFLAKLPNIVLLFWLFFYPVVESLNFNSMFPKCSQIKDQYKLFLSID